MKKKDIPNICSRCFNLKTWNLKMDGSLDISCRKMPRSKMGDKHCKGFEAKFNEFTVNCRDCPYWDKTGLIKINENGEVRMCLKYDFPVCENEGCTVENRWEF